MHESRPGKYGQVPLALKLLEADRTLSGSSRAMEIGTVNRDDDQGGGVPAPALQLSNASCWKPSLPLRFRFWAQLLCVSSDDAMDSLVTSWKMGTWRRQPPFSAGHGSVGDGDGGVVLPWWDEARGGAGQLRVFRSYNCLGPDVDHLEVKAPFLLFLVTGSSCT